MSERSRIVERLDYMTRQEWADRDEVRLGLINVIEAAELWCGGEENLSPRRVQRALNALEETLERNAIWD